MTFQLTATVKGLERDVQKLKRSRVDAALEDCLQIIMQSTLMGYEKRISPTGIPWKANPMWWQQIKGQDSPLVGPITSTIKSGPLAGVYKLAKVNTKRMMHSLKKSKSGMVGKVEYTDAAKDRAKANQYGRKDSPMEFTPISTSSPYKHNLIFNVDIIERPHLGVATYARIEGKTDAEWCEFYFGKEVDIQLQEDFK